MSYYLPASFIPSVKRPPCKKCGEQTTMDTAKDCRECADSLAWERDARA